MRSALVACALGFSLALLGCGNSYQQRPVNLSGNWTATLQNAKGATVFSFTTSLTEVGGTVLNVSSLSFNPATPCFSSQTSASGIVRLSSSGYGYYSGGTVTAMSLTIKGLSSGGASDTLTLQGTANTSSSVSGTWSLTGASTTCFGSGGFTMNKN